MHNSLVLSHTLARNARSPCSSKGQLVLFVCLLVFTPLFLNAKNAATQTFPGAKRLKSVMVVAPRKGRQKQQSGQRHRRPPFAVTHSHVCRPPPIQLAAAEVLSAYILMALLYTRRCFSIRSGCCTGRAGRHRHRRRHRWPKGQRRGGRKWQVGGTRAATRSASTHSQVKPYTKVPNSSAELRTCDTCTQVASAS